MRHTKPALIFLVIASLLFGAAHTAFAEEDGAGQIEYVYVCDDGTEVRICTDSELTEDVIEIVAGKVRENNDINCTLMHNEYYPADVESASPQFPVGAQDLGAEGTCSPDPDWSSGFLSDEDDHTYAVIASVTATKHNVFDDPPKCLECRYKLYACTKCTFKALGFESSRRVACHSGTVVKDWEIYDNYLYYNNSDGHKQDGFVTDSVAVRVKTLVNGKPNRYSFPGIAAYMTGFEYDEGEETAKIYFSSDTPSRPDYTESDIDRYISCLKYLDALPYSDGVFPATGHDDGVSDGRNTDDAGKNGGEAESSGVPDAQPQTPPQSDPPAPPAQGGGVEAPDARQTGGLHNPQTGDSLAILTSAACVAALILTVTIRKYKSIRRNDK